MKTEPTTFSFEDLMKAPKRTTSWEGVRNYQARNLMRDEIKKGDSVLFYHSNTEIPSIVGIAEIVREAYPDPFALDAKSPYYDETLNKGRENPWVMVDLKAIARFNTPISRDDLKAQKSLSEMMVLRKGSRLSVQPVLDSEFKIIHSMSDLTSL